MTRTTEMNNIIEERYQFCISLYLIKKETDKRNKEKRNRGEKNLVYTDIFAIPFHLKILFGGFLGTPLYTEIATLEGHTGSVNCITLHENKVYTGIGSDTTIRIWNTETHEEIATLEGHTHCVRCLTHHENKLYSGSGDNTIRVWVGTQTETYETIASLRGHTGIVYCLTLHENKLYSGGGDSTIRVWKI